MTRSYSDEMWRNSIIAREMIFLSRVTSRSRSRVGVRRREIKRPKKEPTGAILVTLEIKTAEIKILLYIILGHYI